MAPIPPSNPDSQPPRTAMQSMVARFLSLSFQARFLTISLLVHLIIVMLGGTAVLVRNVIKGPNEFVGDPSSLMSECDAPAPPSDDAKADATMRETPALPAVSVSPVSTIMTVAPASFSTRMNSVPSAKIGTGDVSNLFKGIATGGIGGSGAGKKGYFGGTDKTPSALVGSFYDLKQDKHRKPTGLSPDQFHTAFRDFVRGGWKESALSQYFRAPNRLYATQIFIPDMSADEGPKAFEMEKEVQPSRWLVHYKGRISPPQDGTYRFVGGGDDVLVVRFNGKVVLDRCWYQSAAEWKAERNYNYGYTSIPNGFARGDALKVRAGEFYDVEILIGEQPGGRVFFSLLMEQEGVEYRKDARGNPILPVFRVADVPIAEPEKGQTFPPYEPNGPVWRASIAGGSAFDDFFARK